jgi:hypothetical protein
MAIQPAPSETLAFTIGRWACLPWRHVPESAFLHENSKRLAVITGFKTHYVHGQKGLRSPRRDIGEGKKPDDSRPKQSDMMTSLPADSIGAAIRKAADDGKTYRRGLMVAGPDSLRSKRLKEQFRQSVTRELLEFKWQVGKEILVARVQQDDATYRRLEEKTAINYSELARCVQFYTKYPNHDYPSITWRSIIGQLPSKEVSTPY